MDPCLKPTRRAVRWPVLASALGAASLLLPVRSARADGLEVEPIVRLGFGFSLHAEGGRVVPAFNFEITAGFYARTYSRGRQEDPAFVVGPEIGYALDSLAIHALDLTVGLGGGAFPFEVTYQPHLLVGKWSGEFVAGMRNGVALHGYYDFASMELGHTFLNSRGVLHHAFTAIAGFNPPALAQLYATYL